MMMRGLNLTHNLGERYQLPRRRPIISLLRGKLDQFSQDFLKRRRSDDMLVFAGVEGDPARVETVEHVDPRLRPGRALRLKEGFPFVARDETGRDVSS
jgi:hypothetical protein